MNTAEVEDDNERDIEGVEVENEGGSRSGEWRIWRGSKIWERKWKKKKCPSIHTPLIAFHSLPWLQGKKFSSIFTLENKNQGSVSKNKPRHNKALNLNYPRSIQGNNKDIDCGVGK